MFLAHVDPAGGAPTQDLIPAAFVAFAALLGLLLLARPHRTGRSHLLGRATGWTTRPGVRGMPEGAYGVLGAIAAGWIWIIAWGLGRFRRDGAATPSAVVAGDADVAPLARREAVH